MFIHNINPTLLSLGPLEIRWYGLVWAFGFFLAYLALKHNHEKLNLTLKQVEQFFTWLLVGTVVGARIVHVLFWGPTYYLANPLEVLFLWRGGLAFHGGLIGSILVTYYFAKKNNVSFYKLADVLVIPAAFALALGRIANFINAELYGKVTDVSWCVEFPTAQGCRHPSQLYAAFGRFVAFGVLYFISKKDYKDGVVFWWFVILMGLVRIIVDFYRVDYTLLALTMGQWLSIGMVVIGAYFVYKRSK